MNQIEGQEFHAAVIIQKLIHFTIENFERVFVKSTFSKLVGKLIRKILDQSTYPGTWT